jgi:phage-related protein
MWDEGFGLRPVRWVASSRRDLKAFPKFVQRTVGYALYFAQRGEKHDAAKPLEGFGGAGVLEVVEDFDRGTYRAVYTVKFADAVYVLHVFQKKSKQGSRTTARDKARIHRRLVMAEDDQRRTLREEVNGQD